MKKLVRNTLYTGAGLGLIALNNVVSAIDVDATLDATGGDNLSDGTFITTLDNIFTWLIGLLYFVAVVFAIWGWFQILTAGWDEEKVKKWKATLINAVIWLVVIFLASGIIQWIISTFTEGWSAVGGTL